MAGASETIQHGLSEHSHGFGVPIQTRSERIKSTKVDDFAEISTREEQWRYIGSDELGGLDKSGLEEFSGDITASTADGVVTSWIESDHALFGSAGIPEDRVSAAGWEAAKAAYLISVPANSSPEPSSIEIKSLVSDPSALHVIVHAAKGSQATVVLQHNGDAVLSENIEIIVDDEASLTLVSIQEYTLSLHDALPIRKSVV